MNPTSITLTALALAGAVSSGYFWHQTGNQKAEQAKVITELRVENTGLEQDGVSLRDKLANAEARSQALADTLKKEQEQRHLMAGQLADSRRENEAMRSDSEKVAAKSDAIAAESRALLKETESLRLQLSAFVSPEAYAALQKQLKDSQELAMTLRQRIEALTSPPIAALTPVPAGNSIKVSTGKNRLVTTQVRQVKGDKVLLGYGARQGALINADVRLQDGLDYLGFGRVIYVDENQCLVELNKGHGTVPADKDIYLLTPELSEKIMIKE